MIVSLFNCLTHQAGGRRAVREAESFCNGVVFTRCQSLYLCICVFVCFLFFLATYIGEFWSPDVKHWPCIFLCSIDAIIMGTYWTFRQLLHHQEYCLSNYHKNIISTASDLDFSDSHSWLAQSTVLRCHLVSTCCHALPEPSFQYFIWVFVL